MYGSDGSASDVRLVQHQGRPLGDAGRQRRPSQLLGAFHGGGRPADRLQVVAEQHRRHFQAQRHRPPPSPLADQLRQVFALRQRGNSPASGRRCRPQADGAGPVRAGAADQGVAVHQVVLGRLAQAEVGLQREHVRLAAPAARPAANFPSARSFCHRPRPPARRLPGRGAPAAVRGHLVQGGRRPPPSAAGPAPFPGCRGGRSAQEHGPLQPPRGQVADGAGQVGFRDRAARPSSGRRPRPASAPAPSWRRSLSSRSPMATAASAVGLRLSRAKSTSVRRVQCSSRSSRAGGSSAARSSASPLATSAAKAGRTSRRKWLGEGPAEPRQLEAGRHRLGARNGSRTGSSSQNSRPKRAGFSAGCG